MVANAQHKIIGGSPVDISERPFQAAIFYYSDDAHLDPINMGGAVVINNRWLLTAAHCVYGRPATRMAIELGNTSINPYDDLLSIENVFIHPDYDSTNYVNDIAIIKLSSPISYSNNIQPIKISRQSSYVSGTSALVSGWGRHGVGMNSLYLGQLYKASVTIESCTNQTIKAEASEDMPYEGDSGGPLTISVDGDDLLIGLVSYCSSSDTPIYYPSYYTNVGYYFDWICNIVYSINAPRYLCTSESFVTTINDGTYELSSALSATNLQEGSILVSGSGAIYSWVKVYDRWGELANQKYFWVGAPAVSDVSYDGNKISVSTFGYDADIQRVEWKIGITPYVTLLPEMDYPQNGSSLKKTTVKVRATNNCGTSDWYTTSLMLPVGGGGFITSVNAISQCIEIRVATPQEEIVENAAAYNNNKKEYIEYKLANINTGISVLCGKLPASGGNINYGNLPKGMYLLNIIYPNGEKENFKLDI